MNILARCEAPSPSALVRGMVAGRVGLGLGLLTDRVADGGLLHRQQPRLLPVHSSPKPLGEVTRMPLNSMPQVIRAPSIFACITSTIELPPRTDRFFVQVEMPLEHSSKSLTDHLQT